MKSHGFSATDNGVYRTPSGIALLRAEATGAQLSCAAIDLRRVRGKRALLNAFSRALRFPDTFGCNWDALADSLQDLSWLPCRGWLVVVRGAAGFAALKTQEHEVLLEILDAAAEYWRSRGRVFIVLSDADGLPAFPAR